jgi:hypothetical protein
MENKGQRYFINIMGKRVLKATGVGKWLVFMSRGRPWLHEHWGRENLGLT